MESARLLAVHAHPDDESSKGAATMVKYLHQGAQVMVATCTGGERGDILNPALAQDEAIQADIAGYRRQEMARAAEILGIQHTWLGFVDSGFPEGDPQPPLPEGCFALVDMHDAIAPLVRIIREFRPQVMITYNEVGGYPHPDHIMTHKVSMAAMAAAADPDQFPESGAPWQISKVYYDVGFSKARLQAMHDALTQWGRPSPFAEWLERWEDRAEREVTTRIECAEFFAQREAALKAHATQIDPDGPFFSLSVEESAKVWPTEDYELAQSTVSTSLPETDLFAGLDVNLAARPA